MVQSVVPLFRKGLCADPSIGSVFAPERVIRMWRSKTIEEDPVFGRPSVGGPGILKSGRRNHCTGEAPSHIPVPFFPFVCAVHVLVLLIINGLL